MSMHEDKLGAARLVAIRAARYFTTGILSLTTVRCEAIETIAITDRGLVLWNPKYVEESTVKTLAGDWVHEWLHLMLRHMHRAGEREKKLWGIAADVSIFQMVADLGLEQPDFSLRPETFKFPAGETVEAYYDMLEQLREEQRKTRPQPQPGNEKGKPGDCPKDAQGRPLVDEMAPEQRPGGGQCGSGAGTPIEGEPEPTEAAPGRTPQELVRAAKECDETIQVAAAQGHGNVPGGLLVWAGAELAPPRVPWRQKLGAAVRTTSQWRPGAVKRTFRRISRRQAGVEFGVGRPVLAAKYRPVPSVALVLDTSGSMGQRELKHGVEEAAGVLAAVGGKVQFIACDCEVHEQREVGSVRELLALVKGGGGTSFCPAFDAIGKLKVRPEVIVFLTDGGGDAPAEPPAGTRVIWLLVGAHKCHPSFHGGAEWGTFVELDD
jgi:predicted metal-dependent peptidase